MFLSFEEPVPAIHQRRQHREEGRVFQRIAEVFSGQCNMTGERLQSGAMRRVYFFAIRIDLIADTQYAKPAETY